MLCLFFIAETLLNEKGLYNSAGIAMSLARMEKSFPKKIAWPEISSLVDGRV